jgi:catechol 2,3-dioxygenase-like lactoylglutathione lyase family enzyme
MIDHLSTYATDFETTMGFYEAVFHPLGYSLQTQFVVDEDPDFPSRRVCAFGAGGASTFWVIESKAASSPRHIAFKAKSREMVDEFYNTALHHGAKSNGAPGIRPEYHDNYYGAFVFDPDGNDIEAVCHD